MTMSAATSTAGTAFTAVQKFRLGATVHTDDGELGSLAWVALDPASNTVTAIGVKLGVFGGTHMAPIDRVVSARQDDIDMSLTRAELAQSKDKPDGAVITHGTAVTLNSSRAGKVAQITVDTATHTLRHVIVDRGLGGEATLAARYIAQVDTRQISAQNAEKTAARLTAYRPDDELREDVRLAIEGTPKLRVDLPGMDIQAIDGVVWLQGSTASDLNRRLIEDVVRQVPGIDELHNDLYSDMDVAAAVSSALGRDPVTARERIGVYPRLGATSLRGAVRSEDARKKAEEIAAKTPGVRAVRNELAVDSAAEPLSVLAGVTNEEDLVPGGD
jgi:osmotically-inducible protein OsmY